MAASSACLVGNGLSTSNAKRSVTKEFYGSHLCVSTSVPLSKTSRILIVKAVLDKRRREGRRGFLKLLIGNVGIGGSALLGGGKAFADEQGVSSSRMSYSRFLEYLDKDRVQKVDVFENGTIAIVEAVSPELGNRLQRVRVQLPGLSQELLQKFREKNIDFAAHNAQEDSGSMLFNLIGNLAFPLILIGGLFLLSRRSSGGMGGPGGPGFPLAFGQSKAKFQMEPNTGVTFDDVAGVDEAKQDFMEVTVDVPDIRGRTEILKVHAGNKKFDADVSLDVVSMRTPGFSGADLANLLNEAAILAGRRGKTAISSKEIDDSIDRIVAGMEGTVMTDGKSKSLVAYHEVGHAVCGTLTPGHDAVQKVTLIPRGQARGLTWFIPADDPTLISKQQLFARIVGGLGGRAAEEVIFGEPEVTTGAASDLQQITGLAKQMVTTFGMSEIGPWSLMDASAQSGDVFMRMMARNSMSEKLAEDIDTAVKRISDGAYEIALSHIRSNREAIDKIVEVLLEKETMTGDEFRAILSEFVEIPTENQVPPTIPSPVAVSV
ncbi:ATP-DEPENDENT ZINC METALLOPROTEASE FTSH 2 CHLOROPLASTIC [Salix koriyanagi]|uniref:ATP-DEPENDENT ZINC METALLOPROTEASE FTSH 2 CHLOROPLASTIC n=1 Tax=Salix koriyanagi TaxID=2511006 RepID=A0A9Q0Z732_9ROSI|nr:ATP-DEPENDENT ZINC METALLOPROTEASE FTSH 2 CHLOROPLASTIC [Salix koriyanagi]